MPPSTTSLGPCPPRADASATNPGMLRRVTRSWKQWFTLLNRRRLLTRTIASIERSPSVVALDGPYTHDNIYVRGVRLHAAVAGSPSDPLILLIHGAFGGWFDYKDVIAPLAARGFHVAAVDMRGYGLSDKPPSGYELRRCAGDINGVIAALGHDCALLVGTDTGGSVAWTVSTMYPERVSGVVSLGAVHPVDLRRAIRRKPYLFGPLIKRITLFHLPVFILRGLRRAIPRAARREVVTSTTPSYQRSNAFQDTIRLRQKALSIDHTLAPIARNNRLLIAALPARTDTQTANCPVWLLRQPNSHPDQHLVAMARTRTTGPFSVVSVPGATELFFLEDPRRFVEILSGFARSL